MNIFSTNKMYRFFSIQTLLLLLNTLQAIAQAPPPEIEHLLNIKSKNSQVYTPMKLGFSYDYSFDTNPANTNQDILQHQDSAPTEIKTVTIENTGGYANAEVKTAQSPGSVNSNTSVQQNKSNNTPNPLRPDSNYPTDPTLTVTTDATPGLSYGYLQYMEVRGFVPPVLNGINVREVRFRIVYNYGNSEIANEAIYKATGSSGSIQIVDKDGVVGKVRMTINGKHKVYVDGYYDNQWITTSAPAIVTVGVVKVTQPSESEAEPSCFSYDSDIPIYAKVYYSSLPARVYANVVGSPNSGSSACWEWVPEISLEHSPNDDGADEMGTYFVYKGRVTNDKVDHAGPNDCNMSLTVTASFGTFQMIGDGRRIIRFEPTCPKYTAQPYVTFKQPDYIVNNGSSSDYPDSPPYTYTPKFLSTLPIDVKVHVTDNSSAGWGLVLGEEKTPPSYQYGVTDGWCANGINCDAVSIWQNGSREYTFNWPMPSSGKHTAGIHELTSWIEWYDDEIASGGDGDGINEETDGNGAQTHVKQQLIVMDPEDIVTIEETNLNDCYEVPEFGRAEFTIAIDKVDVGDSNPPAFVIHNDKGQQIQFNVIALTGNGDLDGDGHAELDPNFYYYTIEFWAHPDNYLEMGMHRLWFEVKYPTGVEASYSIPLTVYLTTPEMSFATPPTPGNAEKIKYPGPVNISVNAKVIDSPDQGPGDNPETADCIEDSTFGVEMREVKSVIKDASEVEVYSGVLPSNTSNVYNFPQIASLEEGVYTIESTAYANITEFADGDCAKEFLRTVYPCEGTNTITQTFEVISYIELTVDPDPNPSAELKQFYAPANYTLNAKVVGWNPSDIVDLKIYNDNTEQLIGTANNTGNDDIANKTSYFSIDLSDVPVGIYTYKAIATKSGKNLESNILSIEVIKTPNGIRIIDPVMGDTKAENEPFDVKIVSGITINQGFLKLYVDGVEKGQIGPIDITNNLNDPSSAYIITCPGLSLGTHDLTAEAFDSNGNQLTGSDPSNVVTINITLDPSMEIVTITYPISNAEMPQPVDENAPFNFSIDLNGWIPPNVQVDNIEVRCIEDPSITFVTQSPTVNTDGIVFVNGPIGLSEGVYNFKAKATYGPEVIETDIAFTVVVGKGISIGIDDDNSSSDITSTSATYTIGSENMFNTQNIQSIIGQTSYSIAVKGSVTVTNPDTYDVVLKEAANGIIEAKNDLPANTGTTNVSEEFNINVELDTDNTTLKTGSYSYTGDLSLDNAAASATTSPFNVDIGLLYIVGDTDPTLWKITPGETKKIIVKGNGSKGYFATSDVKLYLDDVAISTTPTSISNTEFVFDVFIDASIVTAGLHTLQAKATAPNGSIFRSDIVNVEMGSAVPSVVIVSPLDEEYIESLSFMTDVKVTQSDGSEPLVEVKVEILDINDDIVGTFSYPSDPSGITIFSIPTEVFMGGDYKLVATASTATSAGVSEKIDIHVAGLRILEPLEGQIFTTRDVIKVKAEAIGDFPNGVFYQLNSDAPVEMTVSSNPEEFINNLDPLNTGNYTIKALADVTGDGIYDFESVVVNFVVDQQSQIDCSTIEKYDNDIVYNSGNQVVEGDLVFQCLVDGTQGVLPSSDSSLWGFVGDCIPGSNIDNIDCTSIPDYNSTIAYSVGEHVILDDYVYKCLVDGTIDVLPSSDPTKWELTGKCIPGTNVDIDCTNLQSYGNSLTYNTGDRVVEDEIVYECLEDGVTGILPSSDSSKWKLLGDCIPGTDTPEIDCSDLDLYDSTLTYSIGDTVIEVNTGYECLVDGTQGILPSSDPSKWKLLGDCIDGSNNWGLDCSVIPSFKPSPMVYDAGDEVKEGENVYEALFDGVSTINPPSEEPTSWKFVGVCIPGSNNPVTPPFGEKLPIIDVLFPNPNIGPYLKAYLNVYIGEDYEVALIDVKTTRRIFYIKGKASMTGKEEFIWDMNNIAPGKYIFVARTFDRKQSLYVIRP